jgi:hypothetical protein
MQESGTKAEEASPEADVQDVQSGPSEPSHKEAEVGDEPLSPSAFELVRRVLVGMVQAIEDGADLLGASVREELGRFRTDLVRSLVATFLLAAGGGLMTAGLSLLLHTWIGSWPPVLLVLGGVYLAAGVWLFVSSSASGGDR